MATVSPARTADVLRTIILFKTLSREALDDLAAATVERDYAAGATIIRRGEAGDGLYIVVAGLIQVVGGDEGADEPVLAVLGPGEAFGELALLDGKPRSASVVAAWATRCLFLSREAFLAHLDQHPETARALLLVLAARLREMDRRLTQRS